MKRFSVVLAVLVACCWWEGVGAVEVPARATLQRDGWTIGFAAGDRELAERLAERLASFERRVVEAETQTFPFGPEEIEATQAELAADFARWCALPEAAPEFQREIARLIPVLRAFDAEVLQVFAVRALELWRTDDVRERFRAGGRIPGLVWDEAAGHARWNARFHWTLHGQDHTLKTKNDFPPRVLLHVPQSDDLPAAGDELVKEFNAWMDYLRDVRGTMHSAVVRECLSVAATKVLRQACSQDRPSRWIREGLARWAWREVAINRAPPKEVERYALVAAQLPVISAGRPRFHLENWPEDRHDDAAMLARQVFCNIEEQHGAEAVPRVMNEFWKLPPDQRSSTTLKALYRQLMLEPLEIHAPWRSLGGWDAAF